MRYDTKLLELNVTNHLEASPCVWLLVDVGPRRKARCRVGKLVDVIPHCDQLCLIAGRHTQLLKFGQLSFIPGTNVKKVPRKEKETYSSVLFFPIPLLTVFLIEITLSLGDSTRCVILRGAFQKLDCSPFIAHCTEAWRISRPSCARS